MEPDTFASVQLTSLAHKLQQVWPQFIPLQEKTQFEHGAASGRQQVINFIHDLAQARED